jgi:hypothetical protein
MTMIKWYCNFNIQDSTVQLPEAFVRVVSYKNINDHSSVNVMICNEDETIIVKEYTKTYDRIFNNVEEVYEELIKDFFDAEII